MTIPNDINSKKDLSYREVAGNKTAIAVVNPDGTNISGGGGGGTGDASAANQVIGNTSLSSLDTKFGEVQVSPTANTLLDRLKQIYTALTGTLTVGLPAGASTSAKQDTGNTSLASIDTKVTDVATQTTLALIKSKTDNLDTTLSTRLSESDFDTKAGSLTETAPGTDTASSGLNGRLQRIAQRLSTLITTMGTPFQAGGSIGNTAFIANAGTNLNTSALALETTQSAQSTLMGAVTETAPTTDTASSGLNGRLQRIAQRLTSLIALLPTALGAGGGLKVDGSGTALPISGTVGLSSGTNPIGGITGAGSNAQIKDDTFYGDGVTSGLLSVVFRLFNGTSYDRPRGDVTSGLWVNVKAISSSISGSSPTSATVGIASVSVLAANASRKGLVLTNLSSNSISFGINAPAVLNSGITLTPMVFGLWMPIPLQPSKYLQLLR